MKSTIKRFIFWQHTGSGGRKLIYPRIWICFLFIHLLAVLTGLAKPFPIQFYWITCPLFSLVIPIIVDIVASRLIITADGDNEILLATDKNGGLTYGNHFWKADYTLIQKLDKNFNDQVKFEIIDRFDIYCVVIPIYLNIIGNKMMIADAYKIIKAKNIDAPLSEFFKESIKACYDEKKTELREQLIKFGTGLLNKNDYYFLLKTLAQTKNPISELADVDISLNAVEIKTQLTH